jgi:hypothetical protein
LTGQVGIASHEHVARDPITKPAQAILDALAITVEDTTPVA